ncbi:MAG: hypothetical protein K6F96_00215 [Bacteroidales bacterium]|nr:hypothetical protein [Bacteroidales bacterium]
MTNIQKTVEKTNEISNAEFEYSTTSDFNFIEQLDDNCTAIVMDATVIMFEIQNIGILLKTGKRHTAKVYKLFYHTLREVCESTGGQFNCYSPKHFLLIYPKDKVEVQKVVDIAIKTANLLSITLRETIEQHTHLNFGFGVDCGKILGTKAFDENNYPHMAWFGRTVEKALALSHLSQRPFFVSISRSAYHQLDESLKTTTKKILGIKKQVDIWTRVHYEFQNEKKYMYQTNLSRSFETD